MVVKVELVGDTELVARFTAMPAALHDQLKQAVTALTLNLRTKVMSEYLSGPTGAHTLNVITGRLRRSVQAAVQDDGGGGVVGEVSYGADVPYARIHELGGTIHIPEIVPVNARALHFVVGGQDVFAMRVRAHDVTIPARAPLRSAFAAYTQTIIDELNAAVRRALIA